MVRKKASSRPRAKAERPAITVTIRSSAAWKAWVEKLAAHCRVDVAKLIDLSLVEHARIKDFSEEAPRR
jgi:hypothetical protein